MQYNVGYHLDPTTFVWKKSDGYNYTNYQTSIDFVNEGMDMEIIRNSDLFFHMMLFVLIGIYIAVIYLCDHLVESNRGHSHNPFGFIARCLKCKSGKDLEKEERIMEESVASFRKAGYGESEEGTEISESETNTENDGPIRWNSEQLVRIQNLTKEYSLNLFGTKHFRALDNVSLSIRKNEILSLLGENGAGKTTLISILTGLLKFGEGAVFVQPSMQFYLQTLEQGDMFILKRKLEDDIQEGVSEDQELKKDLLDKLKLQIKNIDQSPINLDSNRGLCRNLISVCPQYDLLWQDLTVGENMRLVGLFKGIPKSEIDTKVDDCLERINLRSEKENYVKNLSGGMKRRISIGLALLGDSELIILDEPTTGLDPVNRKAIWEFIRQLKRQGKTILLTTHIMDEADILSDRVAIINKGQLLTVSDTVSIKSQFQKLNFILAIKRYVQSDFDYLLSILEEIFGLKGFEVKYQSSTSIKINLPADRPNLIRVLVSRLDEEMEVGKETGEGKADLKKFVESYELASLDLEEAYMMLNEEHEKRLEQAAAEVETEAEAE